MLSTCLNLYRIDRDGAEGEGSLFLDENWVHLKKAPDKPLNPSTLFSTSAWLCALAGATNTFRDKEVIKLIVIFFEI